MAELQALMAQMRDFFAAMMQQQQTAMEAMLNNERNKTEAMLNNERNKTPAQAQGCRREVLQEGRDLQRRAGVARLGIPVQVSDQDGQRSCVPHD